MLYDKLNTFATSGSVATAADNILVGDVIDLQGLGGDEASVGGARDIGNGDPVYLVIVTKTEIITAGSTGSITFRLVSDAQAAIDPDNATIHYQSPAYVTDDAAVNSPQLNVGGVPVMVAIPLEGTVYERYLGIVAVVASQEVTAGAIDAFLTTDPHGYKHYPQGDVA